MTLRSRRFGVALAVLIVLLFVGRWGVGFVVERWWADTLAPGVAGFVSTWELLGLALDAAAIITASCWFAVQALLVTRTVVSVQVTHRVGDLHLRELVPSRFLMAGAIAAGVLLGLVAGTGAHAWREPIALAWQGVRYGVTDPLLKQDLGVYVAQLPAWDLAHRFAALLAVVGLAFCTTLYSAIGGLRRERTSIVVHADAQRHLGALLVVVALVIAVGYLLAPYHVAAAAPASLSAASAFARIHSAQVMAGLSIATAALTAWWAVRGRGTLLVATWLVLGFGALIDGFVVPALADQEPPAPSRLNLLRQFDALAWGIRIAQPITPVDTVPAVTSLWDGVLLSRIVERQGGLLEAATPATISVDGHDQDVWLVATPPTNQPDRLDILAFEDGAVAPSGDPVVLRSAATTHLSRSVWNSVEHPRSRPASGSWDKVRGGVTAGGPLRRLMLAWARQAPGMVRVPAAASVDWHLDPVERADAVLPMLSWLPVDVILVQDRPTWVVQGMVAIPDFPLATRAPWDGETVAGVVPGIVCTVDAESGDTHFYVDPAADSLGVAWGRITAPVVAPATAMPPPVRLALGYPEAWLDAQASVLAGPVWSAGQRQVPLHASAFDAPLWITQHRPARQVIFEQTDRPQISAVVTAYRVDGIPQLRLDTRNPIDAATDSREDLQEQWPHSTVLSHLRDSVLAAGDSVFVSPVRWFDGRAGVAAWQSWFAVSPHHSASLIWVASALGDRVGGGRLPADAWASVAGPIAAQDLRGPDATTVLTTARQWLQRADSAFRRGDLTAFGRAFEELRRTLETTPARPRP